VKTAIFGDNNARLYNIQPKRAMLELKATVRTDEAEYEKRDRSRPTCATAM